MSRSIKFNNNDYIDSSGITHNREKLSDIIIIDKFNNTSGVDWKEMLRNKIDYCIPLFTRENQTIILNGGWQNINSGFAMVTRIDTIYQIVWFSSSGAFYCRKNGNEYVYWSTSDGITDGGNGWYTKDYPDRTEYYKTIQFNYTFAGNGWNWVSLGNADLALPTGITFNTTTMSFSGNACCADTAISLELCLTHNSSYISLSWRNKYGGDITNTCFANFHLTVYK